MRMGIKQAISLGLAAVMLLPSGVMGQVRLSAPMDSAAGRKLIENARAAQQEGNHTVALREYGRALEVYPNEPLVRAPIYLAMSEESKISGDSAQAKMYRQMGEALDPGAATRAQVGAQAITRGSGETASAVGQGALTMLAAILQAREAAKTAKLQRTQMLQQQQMAQQTQAQMQMQMQAQPAAPPAGYAYPPAPVGQPGYAPPAQAYQPMPGYAPAPGQVDPNAAMAAYPPPAQMQQPGYPPPAQMQQPGYPPPAQPQYAQQQQPGYPPPAQPQYAQQQQPGYPPPAQPQYAQQQQQPGYPPPAQPQYAQQQQPGYPPPAQPQYAQQQPGYPPPAQPQYAAPASPYGAPQGYAMAMARTRGDAMKPIRVVHDHAVLGDAAYFANGCGALVVVAEGSLTFTPSGGEAPLVIPAAEISDVRLNALVGREIGAFHITTRTGLYLNLAMESGKREDTRTAVEELRKQLGLGE